MKKQQDSDLAQQLMDSLLEDIDDGGASYNEAFPPSNTVSIAGLMPFSPKEEKKLKVAVEKARGFIALEGDSDEGAGTRDGSPNTVASSLWDNVLHKSEEAAQNQSFHSMQRMVGLEEELSQKLPDNPPPLADDENTIAISAGISSNDNDDQTRPEGIDLEALGMVPKSKSRRDDDFNADEKTVAAASARKKSKKDPTTKVRFGQARSQTPPRAEAKVYASPDASLIQAENLRVAQDRILELETEVERVRAENEELAAAGETLRDRSDELLAKTEQLERSKASVKEDLENEITLFKGRLSHKDNEINKLKLKNTELENRLQRDFKKVRVRERELENRLELARMENVALIRSKDETILDLKRRVDQLESEAEAYRNKCQELNHQIDGNQDQFRRTVKALRLALTNLEVSDEGLAPLKKAE